MEIETKHFVKVFVYKPLEVIAGQCLVVLLSGVVYKFSLR